MSAADDEEETPLLRTVTETYRSRPDSEMSIIGWLYFAGMVILLVPLLPFVAALWLLSKLLGPGSPA